MRSCRVLDPFRRTVPATLSLAALACVLPGGCVSSRLIIDSAPQGAEVRLNGKKVGLTPVVVPFGNYGVYRIIIRKEGLSTVAVDEKVLAPWYSRFPLCLFSELLLPWRISDDRYLCYELRRPDVTDRSALLENASKGAD